MTQQTVLVTGGAGFIGSHLVDALLAHGAYRVRVLDNFATGRRENLAHCQSSIELIEGDIRDMESVEEAVAGVDSILHQAALPSVPRSIKAPLTSNDVNVGGTLQLLSAAHRAGVRRVVLASSSSIYGDAKVLPKTETMTPRPMSPYAVTKLAGEHYLRVFAEIYGMETLALRYFNVFGPRQDPASYYSGAIAKFMYAALSGKACTVFGDGQQARDFTYVENVVHANLLALDAPELRGQVVNIACGERRSVLDLIGAIGQAAGHEVPIEFHEARMGDVRNSQAAIEEAKRVLGYEPVRGFLEGIQLTFDWYASVGGTV